MTESSGLTEQQQGQGQQPAKQEVKVFVSGCYDILHGGHLEFWSQARALGTYLIVSFASDDVLSAHKSNRRSSIPTEHKRQLIGKDTSSSTASALVVARYKQSRSRSCSGRFCDQNEQQKGCRAIGIFLQLCHPPSCTCWASPNEH